MVMRTCLLTGAADGDSYLLAYDGLAPLVLGKRAVPPRVASAYQEMVVAAAGLCAPPPLHVVESARGAGGLYLRGGGPIIVGHRDAVELAVRYIMTFVTRGPGRVPRELFVAALDMVYGRVIGHELGHALDEAGVPAPFTDPWQRADYVAGILDALLAKDPALGARFFWSLGCVGPACTHPPPQVRASAYLAGYHAQLSVMTADRVQIL